jgi:WD40 repeat protein
MRVLHSLDCSRHLRTGKLLSCLIVLILFVTIYSIWRLLPASPSGPSLLELASKIPIVEQVRYSSRQGDIREVMLTPEENLVITAGKDGSVHLTDASNGRLVRKLEGHTSAVVSIDLSSTGTLYSGDFSGSLKGWDWATGTVTHKWDVGSKLVAFSLHPREAKLAVTWNDGTVGLFHLDNGQLRVLTRLRDAPEGISFSADGKLFAFSEWSVEGAFIHVWEVNPLKERLAIPVGRPGGGVVRFIGTSHRLVAGDASGSITTWDADTGRRQSTLGKHVVGIGALVVTNDGKILASGDGDGILCLWDLESGIELSRIKAHHGGILSIVFSKDGGHLVTACGEYGPEKSSGHAEVKVWAIRR